MHSPRDEKLLVELNTIENADNRCRLNFVIENKSSTPLESMKLDLVVFGTDGGIMRRLITEMAPVRPAKTIVRAFLVDAECGQIGAILVNDVTACAPAASPAPVSMAWHCRRGSRRCGSTNQAAAHHAFIDSKKSELLLVLRSLSSRKSMASIVPIGFKMRRRMYIFLS